MGNQMPNKYSEIQKTSMNSLLKFLVYQRAQSLFLEEVLALVLHAMLHPGIIQDVWLWYRHLNQSKISLKSNVEDTLEVFWLTDLTTYKWLNKFNVRPFSFTARLISLFLISIQRNFTWNVEDRQHLLNLKIWIIMNLIL